MCDIWPHLKGESTPEQFPWTTGHYKQLKPHNPHTTHNPRTCQYPHNPVRHDAVATDATTQLPLHDSLTNELG